MNAIIIWIRLWSWQANPELEKIVDKRISDIDALSSTVKSLKEVGKVLPELSIIATNKGDSLVEIVSILSEIKANSEELKTIKEGQSKLSSKLNTVVKEAESKGIKFVKCDNCGSYIKVTA